MTTDLPSKWRDIWPGLREEIDALVLVAFRLLVFRLDLDSFFENSRQVEDASGGLFQVPVVLTKLLRPAPQDASAFARIVDDQLASDDLNLSAMLAFAINKIWGAALSDSLDRGYRQRVARAVNTANRALRGLGPHRPVVLVRSSRRYWPGKENVVDEFLGPLQRTASNFTHLLPVSTHLNRVDYSAVSAGGSECTPGLKIALWPAEAPTFDSPAITAYTTKNGTVRFSFKCWDNLTQEVRQQHITLAEQIAGYVRDSPDIVDMVNIIAAPELMLAPQAHDSIIKAIASREHAAWIVFPGSYHIERESGVVNQAPIYVGGALEHADLTSPVSAMKRTAFEFVIPGSAAKHIEDLDGTVCSVHLVDTKVGRIAVMICLDYLVPDLRNDLVSMETDHLFVLSMSPDSGTKFATAMDEAASFWTGSFFVNAFAGNSKRTGYREPLKGNGVNWEPPVGDAKPLIYIRKTKWSEDLSSGIDGIVRRCDGRFAIGAVLLIENDAGEIVVVTKAPKSGYEFGGLDVLPGGLLRTQGPGHISQSDLRLAIH